MLCYTCMNSHWLYLYACCWYAHCNEHYHIFMPCAQLLPARIFMSYLLWGIINLCSACAGVGTTQFITSYAACITWETSTEDEEILEDEMYTALYFACGGYVMLQAWD